MLHCQIRAGLPAFRSTMFVGLPMVPGRGCWPGSKFGNVIWYGIPPARVKGGVPTSGGPKGFVEPKLLALEASLLVLAYDIPPPARSTVFESSWYASPSL